MVLRRMVPNDRIRLSYIVGIETASNLRETHQERWGLPQAGAVPTPKIINLWILSFGTIRHRTILRVPETRAGLSSRHHQFRSRQLCNRRGLDGATMDFRDQEQPLFKRLQHHSLLLASRWSQTSLHPRGAAAP